MNNHSNMIHLSCQTHVTCIHFLKHVQGGCQMPSHTLTPNITLIPDTLLPSMLWMLQYIVHIYCGLCLSLIQVGTSKHTEKYIYKLSHLYFALLFHLWSLTQHNTVHVRASGFRVTCKVSSPRNHHEAQNVFKPLFTCSHFPKK